MSQQDWKSKLTSRFAYSSIALQNDNYDYFQTRRDLAAQLSLLNDQRSNACQNNAKLSSVGGSSEHAAAKQKLLFLTHEITASTGKILSDYLDGLQALQASHIAGSIDSNEFRAQARQRCAAAKDLTSIELDRSMNAAMAIIDDADESVQDVLADFLTSAHDCVMAGLAQQMLDLQKSTDEFIQIYDQNRRSWTTNERSIASFATTVMEATRQMFNKS